VPVGGVHGGVARGICPLRVSGSTIQKANIVLAIPGAILAIDSVRRISNKNHEWQRRKAQPHFHDSGEARFAK
jgi:hypothetical protein